MPSDLLFVGNWKMQLPYTRSIAYIDTNQDNLRTLAQNNAIVLCPSFDALANIGMLLKDTNIALGAQDVSAHASGAYTGQVSATSLKEVGCDYCIVGHSERRQYNGETSKQVAQKIAQLAAKNITPIICIGETQAHRQQGITTDILQEQLNPVIDMIKTTPIEHLCIAYEPIWAIGTGNVASNDEIAQALGWIRQYLSQAASIAKIRLLYGGSVNPDNARTLVSIEGLGGFLVGGASTDFQKFEKIVLLDNK